ncbi:MAG TPA: PQQ-binding-like beta-propeller repeat protein [Vicinamibacterales bacterium]
MRRVTNGWRILCAMLTCAVTGPVIAAQSQNPSWTPIPAERLRAPETGDWINYRRTYDVTAFSPLRQINRTNIRQLRPVWSYSMRDNRRWLPTPLVANGLMYVPEGSGRVVAFDAVSGDVVWIHERKYPEDVSMSEAFPRHRGVSILGNTLYWGTADSYLVALDAQTGKLLWEVKTGDYHLGEGHNHPPLIAEGKVFLGMAGGDLGARGKFRAFDAATGRLLWTVYTAPGPGDPGYETWTHKDVPPLGGAPWNTVSYDPELRLVYFSTGQPAPWSTAQRGPGDALYTNSVLAVDAQTGSIRWHFQLNPADDWDRAAYENMLVDLVINGKPRKALIQTGKIGWGVVLDRQTGEFLHAFKTAYDNVIAEWTPQGRPVINPDSVPTPADIDSGKVFEICPHLHGARNLQAPSYSPLTRLYYLGVNNSCMDAKVVSTKYVPGRSYTGVTQTPKRAPGYDHVGEFVAFDPVTGKRAWTYRTPSGAAMTASALSTAGGLVFGGTADRQFFALNSDTGGLLWQMRLNGDISGAPVTFSIGGKQYVAVGAGGRTGPTTSFAPLTNSDIAQGSGVMWVFAVPTEQDNKVSTQKPSRPVIMSTSGVPAQPTASSTGNTGVSATAAGGRSALDGVFTAGQAARGKERFDQSCAMCHKIEEQAGASFGAKWGNGTLGDLFTVMSTTMPQGKPGSLSADDYSSIVAFYLSQSGYPAGATDLPADPAALTTVRVGSLPR